MSKRCYRYLSLDISPSIVVIFYIISIEIFIGGLKDRIIFDDVNEEVVQALIHNLTDLGILQSCGENSWILSGIEAKPSTSAWQAELLKQMQTLSRTDKGFAPRYC